jgi:hypothetical protein
VGFPLVLMGVFTMFILGISWQLVLLAAAVAMVGTLFFFHPR